MMVTRHSRRRRAALTKFVLLAGLGILVLTPRLDLPGQVLASPSSPAEGRVLAQQN